MISAELLTYDDETFAAAIGTSARQIKAFESAGYLGRTADGRLLGLDAARIRALLARKRGEEPPAGPVELATAPDRRPEGRVVNPPPDVPAPGTDGQGDPGEMPVTGRGLGVARPRDANGDESHFFGLEILRSNTEFAWAAVPPADPHHRFDTVAWATVAYCLEFDAVGFSHGPPGGGKTSDWLQAAAMRGQGVIRVNMSADVSREDFIGCRSVRDGERGSVTGVELGPALLAGIHGCLLLIDEVTAAPSSVLLALQSILEAPRRPDGRREYLNPLDGRLYVFHPHFRVAMCDNTDGRGDPDGLFAGTAPLNSAILDRVGAFIARPYMERAQWTTMLVARSGLDEKKCAELVDFAQSVNKTSSACGSTSPTTSACVSPRTTIDIARIAARFGGELGVGVRFKLIEARRIGDPDREMFERLAKGKGWIK